MRSAACSTMTNLRSLITISCLKMCRICWKAGAFPKSATIIRTIAAQTCRANIWSRTDVIIVEGIHAFYDARLRAMMDLKLYMHVESDICLLRRIQRDINERGRQIDNISSQYITTVKPMFDQYIRNYEQYADVIVAGGGKDAKITEILAGYINNDLHLYRGLNRRRDEKNA